MRKIIINILLTILALAWIAGVYYLHLLSEKSRAEMSCSSIKVEYIDSYRFVTENDIKEALGRSYNYIGRRLDSVNLKKIEDLLDMQAVVKKSQAYVKNDGSLNVIISQRKPVIRFQKGENGFYADETGFIFPLQEKYTFPVPIIEGNLPLTNGYGYKGSVTDKSQAEWMRGTLKMVDYIARSKTWSNNIVQIRVEQNGDMILIPRDGNEKIIFGKPENIEDKFSRINKYYQYIKSSDIYCDYSTVNVKFDKQIICKK